MRSIGRAGLAVVLLSACTRPNPVFGGGDGDAAADGEPTAGGTTPGGTSLEAGEASETRASTADETRGMSGTSETEGDKPACTEDFPTDYTLETDPPLAKVFRGCPAGANYLHIQVTEVNEGIVTGHRCGSECPCPDEQEITMTFDLPLPTLPDCFNMDVRVDPECNVQDYYIRADDASDPVFMASNGVPALGSLAFNVAPAPIIECDAECTMPSPPGHYELVQVNSLMPVPPDRTPTPLMGGALVYSVINDRSGYDPQCNRIVHWYATQMK